MNHEAFDHVLKRAEQTHSDALVVLQDGDLVGEWRFGQPPGLIDIMSAGKLIVGLAIGQLIDEERLALDQPVCEIFPEWRQGRKRAITIRMLLNHTSGLQNVPNAGAEIEPAPDWVQLALAAELDAVPGTTFAYNNKAVLLLPALGARVTGQPFDEVVRKRLFTRLGIQDFTWVRDSMGTVFGGGCISLPARDVAAIGQLMLQCGQWNGRHIVSATWIDQMTAPGQSFNPAFGLLCRRWLDPETGEQLGFYHDGYLGQYLIVLPKHRLVVVRQIRRGDTYAAEIDGFDDILTYVQALMDEL